jgi:hypothetical protein
VHSKHDKYTQEAFSAVKGDAREPDWVDNVRPRITAPLPATCTNQTLNIKDEVDWDDGEVFDVPGHTQTCDMSNMCRPRLQQRSYEGAMHHPDAHASPQRQPRAWERERDPWKYKDKKVELSEFQPPRDAKAMQRPSKAKLKNSHDRERDIGHRGQHQVFTTQEKLAARTKHALLAPGANQQSTINLTPTVPDTVYDLRRYDRYITNMHKKLPPHIAYLSGNGKVSPNTYASVQGQDLGLCFATFATTYMCEMGVKCAWRHHPLTQAEREWILAIGHERGKGFLKTLARYWAHPEVPVPGANMHGKWVESLAQV